MTTYGTAEGTARSAGRPRSARVEKAIIDATIGLIAEGSAFSELSIEAIAARAGVGKTTIYRRWSNKEDLVIDALAALKRPVPAMPGVSVREDLLLYLRMVSDEASDPMARCVTNITMAEYRKNPGLADRFYKLVVEPRRKILRAVFQRGIDSGELRPDLNVDIAMATVVGTMMWLSKWPHLTENLPTDLAESIVDLVMRGMGAPEL